MRPIDEKIVSMKLDNKDFEAHARESLLTFQKLNTGLKGPNTDAFNKANSDLNKLSNTAKNTNLSHLEKSVDGIAHKFSTLGIVGTTALVNIANRAVNTAIDLGKNLTIAPIMDGFREYEIQMGSIQTILANTRRHGTDLKKVTKYLDELNEYADKTIYNFGQMTNNLGLFTNAGMDVDEASKNIQGFMNVAAASGAKNLEAQRAAYQLSQALSVGAVKLMDWRSITNAGMGNKNMQESLVNIAAAMGTVNSEMREYTLGHFNETLKDGWLTADVMSNYLTIMAGKMSEAEMAQLGLNKATIESLKVQQKDAEEAATKVRTISQLKDTISEEIGSGWAQVWKVLIGDFDKATERLTAISEAFKKITGPFFDGLVGGLKRLDSAGVFDNLYKTFGNLFGAIGDVVGILLHAIKSVFPKVDATGIGKITKSIANLTDKLRLSKDTIELIKRALELVLTPVKLLVTLGSKLFGVLAIALVKVGEGIASLFSAINTKPILDALTKWGSQLEAFFKETIKIEKIKTAVVKWIKEAFENTRAFISGMTDWNTLFSKFTHSIGSGFGKAIEFILSLFNGIKNAFSNNTGTVKAMESVSNGVEKVSNSIKELPTSKWKSFKEIMTTTFGSLEETINNITNKFKKLGDAGAPVVESLNMIRDAIWNFVKRLTPNDVVGGITAVSIFRLFNELLPAIKDLAKFTKTLPKSGKKIAESLDSLTKVIKTGRNYLRSKIVKEIATSLLILAGAMYILSKIDPDGLKQAMVAMGTLMTMLMILNSQMSKVKFSENFKIGGFLSIVLGLSVAVVILSSALKRLSNVDPTTTGANAVIMVGMLYGLIKAMDPLTKYRDKIEKFKMATKSISGLVLSLSVAFFILSKIKDVTKPLIALTGMMTILGIFLYALEKLKIQTAVPSLVGLAGTINLLIIPIFILSRIDKTKLSQAMWTLNWLLLMIGIFSKVFSKMTFDVSHAATLSALAGALALLTIPIILLSRLSIGSLIKGLIGIGGAITILVGAAYLAQGAVVGLMALSSTLKGIGIAAAGIGAGLYLAALSFTGIANLAPAAFNGIKNLIKACIQAVLEMVPFFVDAFLGMIGETILALSENVDKYGQQLIDLFIKVVNLVAKNIEPIIDAIWNLIGSIVTAVANKLKDVDLDSIFLAIETIGVVVIVAKVAAGLGKIFLPAAKGIALAGVLIGEIALILATIGALNEITGLDYFVTKGGDLLVAVADSIGRVVGALVAGITKAITASLPEIADSLSSFAKKLQPFIQYMSNVPESVSKSIGIIFDAILNMAKASILQAITNLVEFFTGGSSIDKLGEGLVKLGEAIVEYAKVVNGINVASVNASIPALESLVKIYNNLPQIGGMIGWFSGDQDLETFADGIAKLGNGIKAFGDSVNGIKSAGLETAIKTTEVLVDIQNKMGNSGGVVITFFTGDNKFDEFAVQVVMLGLGLAAFANTINNSLNKEAVSRVDEAIKITEAIVDIQNKMGNSGGVLSFFTGDNKFGDFGDNLESYGKSLKQFSDSVSDLEVYKVQQALNTTSRLANIATLDGVKNGKNLASFGYDLQHLGGYLSAIYKDLKNTEVTIITDAIDSVGKLVTAVNNLGSIDQNKIKSIGDIIEGIGRDSITKMKNAYSTSISSVKSVIETFLTSIIGHLNSYGKIKANAAGEKIMDSFSSGIKNKDYAVRSAVSYICTVVYNNVYVNLYNKGQDAIQGFINGMYDKKYSVEYTASNIGRGAAYGIATALSIRSPSRLLMKYGGFTIEGFIIGMRNMVGGVSKVTNDIVDTATAGIVYLKDEFSRLLDSEFDFRPKVTPVLDMSNMNYRLLNDNVLGGQLSMINNIPRSEISRGYYNRANSVVINNERLLEGAVFNVRSDNDIKEIARSINDVSYDELIRSGVRV